MLHPPNGLLSPALSSFVPQEERELIYFIQRKILSHTRVGEGAGFRIDARSPIWYQHTMPDKNSRLNWAWPSGGGVPS